VGGLSLETLFYALQAPTVERDNLYIPHTHPTFIKLQIPSHAVFIVDLMRSKGWRRNARNSSAINDF
jgi:hypothetical protein